jgi:hypothetical protein
MKMGLWSITRGAPLDVGGKGRSTAKRRERKEYFGGLVKLDGLKSK